MAISHSKDNPFKGYMEYLANLDELTDEDKIVYKGIGREFINVIENTNMTKVYKMPVLRCFLSDGKVRMEVTKEQLLESWKKFFDEGTNWKDFEKDITYDKYKAISDKEHLKKIINMPVHFLMESGKGFFVEKDGYALALRDELKDIVNNECFVKQMGDVIEYRVMDYYRRRYENGK